MTEKRARLIKKLVADTTWDWTFEMMSGIMQEFPPWLSKRPLDRIVWIARYSYIFGYLEALEPDIEGVK